MISGHGHEQKFKYPYPRDNKIIQMPYPRAKAIDQNLFSSPEPTILLACGRNRELWEQPFWNNKGNNRILPIWFNEVFIYGACLKWLLPEPLDSCRRPEGS